MTITPYSISESTKISEAYLNNVVNEARGVMKQGAKKVGKMLGGKAAKLFGGQVDDVVGGATRSATKNTPKSAVRGVVKNADDVAKGVDKVIANNADDLTRQLTQAEKDVLNPKKGIPWAKIVGGAGATDVALSVTAERMQNKDATELHDRLRDIRIQADGDAKKLAELISNDSYLQKKFSSDEIAKIASGAIGDSDLGKHLTQKPTWLEKQFQGHNFTLDAINAMHRVPFVNMIVDGINNTADVVNGDKGIGQAVVDTVPVARQISKMAQPTPSQQSTTSQQPSYNKEQYSAFQGAANGFADLYPSSPLSKFVTPPSLPIDTNAYNKAATTVKTFAPLIKPTTTPNNVELTDKDFSNMDFSDMDL
jgi:hypothetical protein